MVTWAVKAVQDVLLLCNPQLNIAIRDAGNYQTRSQVGLKVNEKEVFP